MAKSDIFLGAIADLLKRTERGGLAGLESAKADDRIKALLMQSKLRETIKTPTEKRQLRMEDIIRRKKESDLLKPILQDIRADLKELTIREHNLRSDFYDKYSERDPITYLKKVRYEGKTLEPNKQAEIKKYEEEFQGIKEQQKKLRLYKNEITDKMKNSTKKQGTQKLEIPKAAW